MYSKAKFSPVFLTVPAKLGKIQSRKYASLVKLHKIRIFGHARFWVRFSMTLEPDSESDPESGGAENGNVSKI